MVRNFNAKSTYHFLKDRIKKPREEIKMKKALMVVLVMVMMIAVPAGAQSLQDFCDVLARNANRMYNDVNSHEYADGIITHDDLATRYAGARSQVGFDNVLLQRDILENIIANRGEVSAQDVNNYVYGRCKSDYIRIRPN
jgi:hypothetical protein